MDISTTEIVWFLGLASAILGAGLGTAIFKLYRDITNAFKGSSPGGTTVTMEELEKIRSSMNAVGKAFYKVGALLVGAWNKFF